MFIACVSTNYMFCASLYAYESLGGFLGIFHVPIVTQMLTVCTTLGYVCYINKDFKVWKGMLLVFIVLVVAFIFIALIFSSWTLSAIFCSVACFYGLFLLLLARLIMFDGLHMLDKDDYMAGAIMMYLDFILLPFYMIKRP